MIQIWRGGRNLREKGHKGPHKRGMEHAPQISPKRLPGQLRGEPGYVRNLLAFVLIFRWCEMCFSQVLAREAASNNALHLPKLGR